MEVPCFVLTHRRRDTVHRGAAIFSFITDGVDSALAQARAAAGARSAHLMGAETTQQFLAAWLVEEIRLHLVPVLFGGGTRLIDNHGDRQVELERTRLVQAPDVTHVWYRVVHQAYRSSLSPSTARA